MNAAQWAARFATKPRPALPKNAQARWLRNTTAPAANAPAPASIVHPGMVHRAYPWLPDKPYARIVGAVPGLVGGAGYTHSTAPGGAHLYPQTAGPGHK